MSFRIDRIAGQVMTVNSFVVHGPDGLVVVDGMLTTSDAALVRQAIDDADVPLAGVVITHPHPDHYAGLTHIVGDDELPIIATSEVAAVIRRDDATKDAIVGPMMGQDWPTRRLFPNHTVGSRSASARSVPASPSPTPSGSSTTTPCLSVTSPTTGCTPTSPTDSGRTGST
jgi:glyoxylase-like metal-dependent hydrolase (beta-lactamase superfamily II)